MNEQQHLEEVIGRFLQNTRENEEISKEEAQGMVWRAGTERFSEQGGRTEKMGCLPCIVGVEEPYFNKRKISEYSDETGADHRPDETLQK